MKATAFDGMKQVELTVDNDLKKEDRTGRRFFAFDPENESLLKIEVVNEEPLPHEFSNGYLFRVDFDESGESYEITLVS